MIFPDGSALTTLNNRFLRNTPKLKTITFEGETPNFTTIGSQAFTDSSIESFTIPASITTIQSNAFMDCKGLQTVEFAPGSQLEFVGNGAFADCGITNVSFPESIITIGREAFRNCTDLVEVNLEKNAKTIDPEAFKYCSNLKAINVVDDNPYLSSVDGMLLNKSKETLVLFPAGKANDKFTLLAPSITKIGDYAFYYCENLKNVTIPNKVTEIGKRAFGMCNSLNTITFLCDEMIDPAKIAQALNESSFDDGVTNVDGTDYRKNITLNVRQDQLENYQATSFYADNFKGINPSFVEEGAEYIAVSDNAVDLLSIPEVNDYTYILPLKVTDPNDQQEKTVSLVGDYLFQNVTNDVNEVVVYDNVEYIGAKAFMTDIANNTSKVKAIFFIESEPTSQMLSTTRFKLNDTGKDYSEIASTTKIYVKKSALEKYQEVWANSSFKDNIDYKIKDVAITTKYGSFSREFDVDLPQDSQESGKKVMAFTAGRVIQGDGEWGTTDTEWAVVMRTISEGEETDGTYIPANTGVVLRVTGTEGTTDDDFYYAIGENAAYDNPAYEGSNVMNPVTINTKAVTSDGTMFVLSKGYLKHVAEGKVVNMPVHKAYMTIEGYDPSSGAKLSFVFDDGETTGIESIDAAAEADADGKIYNLQGQRVMDATKGVYIKNGSKFIMK